MGGLAAAISIGVLAIGPAGAADTTTTSTTATTEAPSTTLPHAVSQTAKPVFNCFGADAATTTLLNSLGPAEGFTKDPTTGNYYIVSNWTVTSSVPEFLENGQTFPVSFSASLDVSGSEASLPAGATLTVTGAPQFVVTGGGSGGPFAGSPTSGSVTPPATTELPPITASGSVTGVDKATPIVYSMAQPLLSSIIISTGGTPLITLNLTCSAVDPDVAATNGSLPPEPPTTLPPATTSTTAAAAAVAATANFTG
jgi:hypothetical protein